MKRNKQAASRGKASPPRTALKKNKRGRTPSARVGQAAAAAAGLRIQLEKEHDDELQDDALDDEQKDDALDDASQLTTTFARPQKRKSKISTPAVRYPRHRKKTHGH